MKKPHIRRSSFWSYAALAVPKIIYFGLEDGDIHSTPALVKVAYLPNLLFFAVHDIRKGSDPAHAPSPETTAVAIETTRLKLATSIRSGVLPVYDPVMFLPVSVGTLEVDNDEYLVRLDDFSAWCSDQGIEIDPFPSKEPSDVANEIGDGDGDSGKCDPCEKYAQQRDIDPADLPDELSAANIAFRAVTNGHGDQAATFKNRLIDYLEKNFTSLNNEAVQRIATVANPDKGRGRKKSIAQ
jgi:hypothetical protein